MGLLARRPRRGFTLIEVLIAALVLVLVIVPLIGLLTTEKTSQSSEEGMSEAVAFCQEMMEKILSNNLPFECIDPGGGAGLPTAIGGVAQAGFKDATVRGQSFSGATLEKILNDGTASGTRVRQVKNKHYQVFFFAGRYPDKAPIDDNREPGFKRADIENTLTFSYLEKPAGYGQPYNFTDGDRTLFDRMTILSQPNVSLAGVQASPYALDSFTVATGATARVNPENRQQRWFYHDLSAIFPDKPGQTIMPGWPDPTKSTGGFTAGTFKYDLNDADGVQRDLWAAHLKTVATGAGGNNPTLAYHPVVIDQKTFKETNGSLMKLILGVKFFPYETSALRKDTGDNSREFWLVSFKSNLEN